MLTQDEVIATSNRVADAVGLPRVLLLACAIAESNLRPDARRPADPAQDAAFWPDVSYGPWQQTVRWSQEYRDWCLHDAPGHDPNAYPGLDVVEAVFDHYRDVEHAARVAAAQLKRHYRPGEPDAEFKALCRYNWPQGGGAPKSPAVAENYRRGLAEARAILGEGEPAPAPGGTGGIVYEEYRDPQPAGRFGGTPKGVILHGSRSGRADRTKLAEYRATAEYEVANAAGLGWHATIGEGRVAVHLSPLEWGWNARAASPNYLAVELAQATVDEPITDAQVAALADYLERHVFPAWPDLPRHFPSHAELDGTPEYGNAVDGKSDVFPDGDPRMDDLRARLLAALGAAPEQPQPTPAPDDELAALRARVAALEAERARLIEGLAVVGDDYADQLQALVDAIRAVRAERVGPRPAA